MEWKEWMANIEVLPPRPDAPVWPKPNCTHERIIWHLGGVACTECGWGRPFTADEQVEYDISMGKVAA